jgi:EpsI family protein
MKKNDQYLIVSLALLLLAGLLVSRLEAANPIEVLRSLDSLPVEVGDYHGREAFSTEMNYRADTADSSIYRTYVAGETAQLVHAYVGYWESQSEEKRIKLPRYVFEGWGYYWIRKRHLATDSYGKMSFHEFLNEGRNRKELVYYSYIVNGKIGSNDYWLRGINMWNALFHKRNNAAVVRVSSFLVGDESVERAEERVEEFIQTFMPAVMDKLPG